MPGIAGIISRRPARECEQRVKAMIASMKHEAFYKTGTYSVPQLGIYGGWVALDHSALSTFSNSQKNVILILSGECYLDSKTATGDQIIRLYEQSGQTIVEELNGLFSGLLIDQRQNKAFLFNDRYGSQRIYFHATDDDCYFASEAKALLRILPELREFNPAGMEQFLTFGCTLDWQSIFRGIQIIPGGSLWTFENGTCRKEKYFSPETWESQPQLSAGDFEGKFQEIFKRILPRYFSSDSKIGIALTGGLDTRMIMACRPPNNGSQICYTFAGIRGETLDDKIAASVAVACGLEHKLLRLQSDFFSNFAAHADKTVFVTDGCFGISGAHEIYFNRQARELATMRLTGNYGSEVFRGISTFKPLGLSRELFNPEWRKIISSETRKFSEQKKEPMTFAIFKEIPWNLFGSLAAGRSQVGFRTPYLDNELVALAYQSPEAIRKSSLPASRLVKACSKTLSEIPTDRGFAGDNFGLKYLCRRAFAEVTFKMDYYNNEGLPRRLSLFDPAYKFAASKLKLGGLHKYLHYSSWFRDELADYVRQTLLDPQIRQSNYIDPEFAGQMVEQHTGGKQNLALEINLVLTLESIERQLFKNLPRGLETN
jgi:asparagine synthase (glutamine-hydrolysing)